MFTPKKSWSALALAKWSLLLLPSATQAALQEKGRVHHTENSFLHHLEEAYSVTDPQKQQDHLCKLAMGYKAQYGRSLRSLAYRYCDAAIVARLAKAVGKRPYPSPAYMAVCSAGDASYLEKLRLYLDTSSPPVEDASWPGWALATAYYEEQKGCLLCLALVHGSAEEAKRFKSAVEKGTPPDDIIHPHHHVAVIDREEQLAADFYCHRIKDSLAGEGDTLARLKDLAFLLKKESEHHREDHQLHINNWDLGDLCMPPLPPYVKGCLLCMAITHLEGEELQEVVEKLVCLDKGQKTTLGICLSHLNRVHYMSTRQLVEHTDIELPPTIWRAATPVKIRALFSGLMPYELFDKPYMALLPDDHLDTIHNIIWQALRSTSQQKQQVLADMTPYLQVCLQLLEENVKKVGLLFPSIGPEGHESLDLWYQLLLYLNGKGYSDEEKQFINPFFLGYLPPDQQEIEEPADQTKKASAQEAGTTTQLGLLVYANAYTLLAIIQGDPKEGPFYLGAKFGRSVEAKLRAFQQAVAQLSLFKSDPYVNSFLASVRHQLRQRHRRYYQRPLDKLVKWIADKVVGTDQVTALSAIAPIWESYLPLEGWRPYWLVNPGISKQAHLPAARLSRWTAQQAGGRLNKALLDCFRQQNIDQVQASPSCCPLTECPVAREDGVGVFSIAAKKESRQKVASTIAEMLACRKVKRKDSTIRLSDPGEEQRLEPVAAKHWRASLPL